METFDLRLYYQTFQFSPSVGSRDPSDHTTTWTSELMAPNPLDTAPVSYLETLGNKVVKFLLTGVGTDLFDPSYGAYTANTRQFGREYLPKYSFEFHNDLRRCKDFIQKTETPGAGGERLAAIKIIRIQYDYEKRPNELYRVIEIVTTLQRNALVAIPGNT